MPRLVEAFEMLFTLVVEGESGPDDEVFDGARAFRLAGRPR
jgi:hypothetical protein